jgi:hypothetical protein
MIIVSLYKIFTLY